MVNDSHIPDDLAFSILPKFPMKSLKRFGCVCKSWSLLFENPHFMSTFRNNFADTSLLLKQDSSCPSLLYLLSGDRFENRVKIEFPSQFQLGDPEFLFCVLGSSANGIFCLHAVNKIRLWNPATGEFKVIPPRPVEFVLPDLKPVSDLKGFGYDHVRDDYKVIRYVKYFGPRGVPYDGPFNLNNISLNPFWEIYSLRSDSWKKLDCEMASDFFWCSNGVRLYTDGVCHWWGCTNGNCRISCLVSFDLSNEVFFTTPMPSYMEDDGSLNYHSRRVHLTVMNGSIAFISNYVERTTFEVSILGEVGVKESWTKLFTFRPLPYVMTLIGGGKKGDIFFRKKNGQLVWFDWSTNMIVELGVKGGKHTCEIVAYKENFESLISFGFEK